MRGIYIIRTGTRWMGRFPCFRLELQIFEVILDFRYEAGGRYDGGGASVADNTNSEAPSVVRGGGKKWELADRDS